MYQFITYNANRGISEQTVAENVASVYARVTVIMPTVAVLKGVLMDTKGRIVKKVCSVEIESLMGNV